MGRVLVAIVGLFSLMVSSCTVESAATPDDPSIFAAPVTTIELPQPQRYFVNLDSIPFVNCGAFVGTGEIIAPNTVMTAAHVVGDATECRIGQAVAVVTENNRALDYAILTVPTTALHQKMKISCRGFVAGRTYYAIGYAHGRDFAITRLVATSRFERDGVDRRSGTPFTHTRILDGEVFPGMSGGPIVDQDGVQVGITSATSIGVHSRALSRELKDTSVCSGR